ncbi:MAG TPA: hypothetical protein DCQ06_03205 [Myxococcales bacterium]|nr:hypothetical protein [Myxococcales bacterium]
MPQRALNGSKWTRVAPLGTDRHYMVVGARRESSLPTNRPRWRYTLKATISGASIDVCEQQLNDLQQWAPGWRRLG